MAPRPSDRYWKYRAVMGCLLIAAAIVLGFIGQFNGRGSDLGPIALFLGTGTVMLGEAAGLRLLGR